MKSRLAARLAGTFLCRQPADTATANSAAVRRLDTASSIFLSTTRRQSEVHPGAAPPVAAALMLAEFDLGPRLPAVFADDHLGLRRVGVPFLHMPACVADARDVGGCARGG